MKLNRTGSNWTELERNKINENWRIIEGNYNDVVDKVSEEAFKKVVDSAKLNWKEPVDSFADLPGAASEGDTRMARDSGKVYRFNGEMWQEIQQIDAGPVNEVDRRLTEQLAQIQVQKADKSYVDTQLENIDEKHQEVSAKLAQKFDQVLFDLSSQKINFYSNGRLIDSVDISEASNARAVQEYIDTLVSDGAIEGVVLGNESVGTLQLSYKSVTNEKIAVAKVGKNLFDKTKVTNVLLSRTTGEEFPNDDYYSSDYIPIKPNTTYARRYQSRVIFYNSKVEFLEGTGEENPSAEINVPGTPVTSPEGARYARISFRSSDPRMLNQFTFEEGDEISTFEPHYHELKNTAASDISRFRASDTSFEYDDAGNLKRVIEGGITTNFFYSNGEITHIITTDSELGTQKRTDFIMEDGTVKEITERFV